MFSYTWQNNDDNNNDNNHNNNNNSNDNNTIHMAHFQLGSGLIGLVSNWARF